MQGEAERPDKENTRETASVVRDTDSDNGQAFRHPDT